MDKNCLPIVYTNKSNLISNYKALSVHPVTRKPQDFRFRGSMFVNMLNNIKHTIINRTQTHKKTDSEADKENNVKISLQIKNYYLSRKNSNQKYLPGNYSVGVKKDDRLSLHTGKTFHMRTSMPKKLPPNKFYREKGQIEEFFVSPSIKNMQIPPKICQQAQLLKRTQFHELPDPEWSIVIPSYMLSFSQTGIQKLEHLFSEMLFEGIDPIIRLQSYSELKKLPSQFRELCHLLYSTSGMSESSAQFLFVRSSSMNDSQTQKKIKNSHKLANFAEKILCIQSLHEIFVRKWIYSLGEQKEHGVGYLKMNDLFRVRNIWVDNQTKFIKFQYQGNTNRQIQMYFCENDPKLLAILEFQKKQQQIGRYKKCVSKEMLGKNMGQDHKKIGESLKEYWKELMEKKEGGKLENQKKYTISNTKPILSNTNSVSKHRMPDKQNSKQECIMVPINQNPKRLAILKNPDPFLTELYRNNIHIAEQIGQFTRKNQHMKDFLQCLADSPNTQTKNEVQPEIEHQLQENKKTSNILEPLHQNSNISDIMDVHQAEMI